MDLAVGTLFVTRLTGRPGEVRRQSATFDGPATTVTFVDRGEEAAIHGRVVVDVVEWAH